MLLRYATPVASVNISIASPHDVVRVGMADPVWADSFGTSDISSIVLRPVGHVMVAHVVDWAVSTETPIPVVRE